MCGINGIIRLNGDKILKNELDLMNKKIVHRGPDDQGVFIDGNVGLGHVRLAILDLSQKGHQPMVFEHNNKKAIITYNGEVYNFKEIRSELERKGYKFKSDTDTEVLVASYMEYGIDCIQKWNGMFAFVIYDPQKQILFGARDRFGQKPLKYYMDDKQFIFSSELKAILENKIYRKVDYDAINDFLTLQYVPAPKTGFKNINKLPHSHYFILNLTTRQFEINRYFDLDFSKKLNLSEKEWMDLIEKNLEKAVKKRLISDVPLGAFLSGGVDSSAIVAFMSKFTDKIKTFSISFDEKDFDESKYARQVAELYNTEHTEFNVKSYDLLKYIEDLTEHYEEPYADSSQLPTFILSKLTKQYVTVALSGDAGDENFGGYDKYRRHVFLEKYAIFLKPFIIKPEFFKYLSKKLNSGFFEKLFIFSKTLNKDMAIRHYNYTTYFDEFIKKELYNPIFIKQISQYLNPFINILKEKDFSDIDKAYYLDFNSYIPDDINVKVDMASMKNSLEVRSPMLDFEFVQMTSQIPWHLKTGVIDGKKIFKKMLEKYLPKKILYRKKQGFGIPIKHWFRNQLKDYIKNILLDEYGLVHTIIKKESVQKLIFDHNAGKDNAKKLWTLMALNIWHKKYFQNF